MILLTFLDDDDDRAVNGENPESRYQGKVMSKSPSKHLFSLFVVCLVVAVSGSQITFQTFFKFSNSEYGSSSTRGGSERRGLPVERMDTTHNGTKLSCFMLHFPLLLFVDSRSLVVEAFPDL
jgi:hypothetical protein